MVTTIRRSNCQMVAFRLGVPGGHFIAVIPALNVVVVHRVNTDDPAKKVTFGTVWRTLAPHPRRQEKIESWCPLRFMIAILRDTNLAQVW